MKVFLTHPSCLGSPPLVSSSTFIHCFSCCHGSFLCVPLPCPSPACRAGELWQSCGSLVVQQKIVGPGFYSSCSRYTVLPAAFPLLIIQKLASCRTSALHGHLYFLSHPWLSVHRCHLISTTQHCSFHPWVTSDT